MSHSNRLHGGLNLGQAHAETHRQAETMVFGFWIFLMSDLVLFAVILATYADASVHGLADGPGPAELFELRNPFIETLLLLASSVTFGMAALHLKYQDDRRGLVLWMLATGALGLVFVAMEGWDFYSLVVHDDAPPQRSGFLSVFFLLVGMHGLHVIAATVWMLVLLIQIGRFGLMPDVKLRILRLSIFWHMLDVVWVAIFTFVYLSGVAR
ncbi:MULTISPECIES: cytochrome c oxidase subunit 3 [unclassified Sulfitobacter]|uniref:cytochrome c oxidase subunit 3 n=1 Tax=unclassified Sulfitobacter TaxID=196795 RepID=UPI0007C315E6|nr:MULTISPECIES: cytochrome c oxidase subunit 3 [unclassified Sulfitobacter]KZY04985.1 cytochrome o ubiquinol oxidase subunit III [Sulfitobacter sp. HI0023]KZY23536.1 cytochrome o ubiquinol oxidase subunit III [Sulfitobacter sp. HI0040]KZZ68372.1 cytochrome o ubiquinol oxidase subunit III [Sulfitobacter sp. HI0129]